MRWLVRTSAAAWLTAHMARSRAEIFTGVGVVTFATSWTGVQVRAGDRAGAALSSSHEAASAWLGHFGVHARLAAEPCSLLLLGTGAISASVLLFRSRFRIKPEALLEAQSCPVALSEAPART